MQVYIVMENYWNGYQDIDRLVGVYENEADAKAWVLKNIPSPASIVNERYVETHNVLPRETASPNVGDTIQVDLGFGKSRSGVVVRLSEESGTPVADYSVNGSEYWCYIAQISRIVEKC
jgi:hypothetical protein